MISSLQAAMKVEVEVVVGVEVEVEGANII